MSRTPYSLNSYVGGANNGFLTTIISSLSENFYILGNHTWNGLGSTAGFWAALDYGNPEEEKIYIPQGDYDWASGAVYVTGVTRGADGTTARSHTANAIVVPVLTATDLAEANTVVNQTIGSVTTSGTVLSTDGTNLLWANPSEGIVVSVVAGSGIVVNSTDPANPIVSAGSIVVSTPEVVSTTIVSGWGENGGVPITLSTVPASGNLLVSILSIAGQGGGGVPTINWAPASGSTLISQVSGPNANNNPNYIGYSYTPVTSGTASFDPGTVNVAVSSGQQNGSNLIVYEITNVDTNDPVDTYTFETNNTGYPTSGFTTAPLTPTLVNELLIGTGSFLGNGGTIVVGSGADPTPIGLDTVVHGLNGSGSYYITATGTVSVHVEVTDTPPYNPENAGAAEAAVLFKGTQQFVPGGAQGPQGVPGNGYTATSNTSITMSYDPQTFVINETNIAYQPSDYVYVSWTGDPYNVYFGGYITDVSSGTITIAPNYYYDGDSSDPYSSWSFSFGGGGVQGAQGFQGPQGAQGSTGPGVVGDSRLNLAMLTPNTPLPQGTWIIVGQDTAHWTLQNDNSSAGSDISLNADGKTININTTGTYMVRLAFQYTSYHGSSQVRFATGASAVGGNFPGWLSGDPDPLTIAVAQDINGDYIGDYIWRIAAGGSFTIALGTWGNTSNESLDGVEMDIVRIA